MGVIWRCCRLGERSLVFVLFGACCMLCRLLSNDYGRRRRASCAVHATREQFRVTCVPSRNSSFPRISLNGSAMSYISRIGLFRCGPDMPIPPTNQNPITHTVVGVFGRFGMENGVMHF
jgi:hypothetical protein